MQSLLVARPIMQFAYWKTGKPQLALLNQIRERPMWPTERLREYQTEHLRRLLQHCAAQVPYYQELFRQVGFDPDRFKDPSDLAQLPVLTKDILLARRDDLVSRRIFRPGLKFDATGGSTGRRVEHLNSRQAMNHGSAAFFRGMEWAGVDVACPKFYLWGHPAENYNRSLQHRLEHFVHNRLYFNAYRMGERDMREWYSRLQRFRPQFSYGYVTSTYTFARFLNAQGLRLPSMRAAMTTAEPLLDFHRAEIESAFGCKSYTQYGSREVWGIGAECAHGALHINEDINYVELERPGHAGPILLTPLFNYAMPLIRYDVEDAVEALTTTCACGRTFRTARVDVGRMADNFRLADGTLLYGGFFTRSIVHLAGINRFQFVQTALDRIQLRVEPLTGMNAGDRESLLAGLRNATAGAAARYQNQFSVSVELTDHIEPSPSGKHRYCLSLVTASAAAAWPAEKTV